jgi:hypothetical protein
VQAVWRKGWPGSQRLFLSPRMAQIPAILTRAVEQALHRPAGFASYEALRQWVRQTHGVEVKYKTLYTLVRTRFKTKLKVARPNHTRKP